jgi:hypothetical protein
MKVKTTITITYEGLTEENNFELVRETTVPEKFSLDKSTEHYANVMYEAAEETIIDFNHTLFGLLSGRKGK